MINRTTRILVLVFVAVLSVVLLITHKGDQPLSLPASTICRDSTLLVAPASCTLLDSLCVEHRFMSDRQQGFIGASTPGGFDDPYDNHFSVTVSHDLKPSDEVWLRYYLQGVHDFSNVGCRINDRLAFGGCQLIRSNGGGLQRVRLSASWLKKGVNSIFFSLPDSAHYGYVVRDLGIEIIDGTSSPCFDVQALRSAYDGQIYFHGFSNRGVLNSVLANGVHIPVFDNSFEGRVPLQDGRLLVTALVDGIPYTKQFEAGENLRAEALFSLRSGVAHVSKLFIEGHANHLGLERASLEVPDGSMRSTRRLSLTSLRCLDIPCLDVGMTNVTLEYAAFRFLPHGAHFHPSARVALAYDPLKIPQGYTPQDIRSFYFDSESSHWVALELDSIDEKSCLVYSNTTHFTDMINGVIKTPESAQTQGFTPTMMTGVEAADPASGLVLISPAVANNMGSARLDYELLLPPMHPHIKPRLNIEYNSDAGSGWLGKGWDLSISSIRVDTRWGVPRFDPRYESETYTLDGVTLATILDTLSTDTLGVATVAHKGVLYERLEGLTQDGVQFHPVRENDFGRITRIGTSVGDYSWRVIKREGVSYTYGEPDHNAVLKGNVHTFEFDESGQSKSQKTKEVIAEWHLSTVEDQYRNFCKYYYRIDSFAVLGGSVYAKTLTLSQIRVGRSRKGSSSSDTLYQVIDFIRSTPVLKKQTSARYGFLCSSSGTLLDTIRMSLYEPDGTTKVLRSYVFEYDQGPFSTSLLKAVHQCDDQSKTVFMHGFDYVNQIDDRFFQPEESISTTDVGSGDLASSNERFPSLGGSISKSQSGSFHLGVGAGAFGVSAGVGLNYSTSKSSSLTQMTMVDMNGDGLPDKLYKGSQMSNGARLCFVPNLGEGRFLDHPIEIFGYRGDFTNSSSSSNTVGWSGDITVKLTEGAKVTANAGYDELTSSSTTHTYLSDVNSDGLIDIVRDGVVYFNTIQSLTEQGVGIPSFSTNSGVSPRPLMNTRSILGKGNVLKLSDLFNASPNPSLGGAYLNSLLSADPIERDPSLVLREKIEDYDLVPMQDVVRFWEAPFEGSILLSTSVKFLGDPSVEGIDGVHFSIQTLGEELWRDSICPNNFSRQPIRSFFLDVQAGQRIYFRLQSGSDFFSDGMEDVVSWPVEIMYESFEGLDLHFGEKLEDNDEFSSDEGDFVSQFSNNVLDSVGRYIEPDSLLFPSLNFSRIAMISSFSKPLTPDSVFMKVYRSTDSLVYRDSIALEYRLDTLTGLYDTTHVAYKIWTPNEHYEKDRVIYSRSFGTAPASIGKLRFSTSVPNLSSVSYRFELSSHTNLSWKDIHWKPSIRYYSSLNSSDTVLYAGVDYRIFERNTSENLDLSQSIPGSDGSSSYTLINPSIQLNASRPVNSTYTLVINNSYHGRSAVFHGRIVNNTDVDTVFKMPPLANGRYYMSLYLKDTIPLDRISGSCQMQIPGQAQARSFTPYLYHWQGASRRTYGHMWRGWGQFQYNAGSGRHARPLVEDSLFVYSDTSCQALSSKWQLEQLPFVAMSHQSMGTDRIWCGSNEYLLLKGDTMCAGRLNYGEMPTVLLPSFETEPVNSMVSAPQAYASVPPASMASSTSTGTVLTGPAFEVKNAPVLSNRSTSSTYWGGASVEVGAASLGRSLSGSESEMKITSAFTDMNGDGFPDYITDDRVEYTNPNGGRDGEVASIVPEVNHSHGFSAGFSGGASASQAATDGGPEPQVPNASIPSSSGVLSMRLAGVQSVSSSSSYSRNETSSTTGYMDVNGDGLPDRVFLSGGKVWICLNLGYGFSAPIDWGLTQISHTLSYSTSRGVSADGAELANELMKIVSGGGKSAAKLLKWMKRCGIGVSLGVNGVGTDNYRLYNLFDVNNDGLPDKLFKNGANSVAVAFNKGDGFTSAITIKDLEDFYKSFSLGISANLGVSVNINLLFIRLSMGASAHIGWADEYTLEQMLDMDGDGFPDFVRAELPISDRDKLTIRRSQIGCTNKLSSVHNSLGGRFSLSYDRSPATYDHPSGKWVLRSVSVHDGMLDDGDSLLCRFHYSGGRYDRYERDFLGFSQVVTEDIHTDVSGFPVYRKRLQVFDNSSYFTRGTLLSNRVYDVSQSQEKIHSGSRMDHHTYLVSRISRSTQDSKLGKYSLIPVDASQLLSPANRFLHQYILYSPLKYSVDSTYTYDEDRASGMAVSQSYIDYHTAPGTHGEISDYRFSDRGGLSPQGTGSFTYRTHIEYLRDKPYMTLFSLPVSVEVRSGSGVLLRRTQAQWWDDFSDQLKQVSHYSDSQTPATTHYAYDAWGNLSMTLLPANAADERMWYAYAYENRYHLFPTRVSDRFGYTSGMSDYDYGFGIPKRHYDINGNVQLTQLDRLGRVISLTGPNEVAQGRPYTLAFEYPDLSDHEWGGSFTPVYALTRHYDETHAGNDLETLTFCDGFGRAVQVKKDGFVNGMEVSLVSGRLRYDPFGRVIESYHPTIEPLNNKRVFNAGFDDSAPPTISTYDVLNRVRSVKRPDGSLIETRYAVEDNLLKSTVVDALEGMQSSYTTGGGQCVKTEQHSDSLGVLTTLFEYDGVGQLLCVTDANGKRTESTYDLVGRRLTMVHPSWGTTRFTYDAAGNLLSKVSSNLARTNDSIRYEYDCTRLQSVHYPLHPEQDVEYVYGAPTDTGMIGHNRAGRLKYLIDASGAQEYEYGRMGELTGLRRTLLIPGQGEATYVTNWQYDSWNRVLRMDYPDGETLHYSYNLGGLLDGVSGKKGGITYPYVLNITYDRFEQRSSMTYGNGVVTQYAYDDKTRYLRSLSVETSDAYPRLLMSNEYSYDPVGNVLSLVNEASVPSSGIGGSSRHSYGYDDLYRLTSAQGSYQGSAGKRAGYALTLSYDKLHNICSKRQDLSQENVQFAGVLNTGYDLDYTYDPTNGHQVSSIADTSYRGVADDAPCRARSMHYAYDDNGNLERVLTTHTATDGAQVLEGSRRLLWDEENRLLAVSDNGYVSNYLYDASGERTLKLSGAGSGMFVNGLLSGGETRFTEYTVYVSPYVVINGGGQLSKHIYMGSQRIVSKLCSAGSSAVDPRLLPKAAASRVDYSDKRALLLSSLRSRYDSLKVSCPEMGAPDPDFWVNTAVGNESNQYFYHSDHLGSSSLITNLAGTMVQHLEYVPFGEVFLDERISSWATPYKFNAKELDEETGLYYYGARYYDPRTSLWLSVDPLAEKYPNVSPYVYCVNNPVKYVDPDGQDWYQFENKNGSKSTVWSDGDAKTVTINDQVYNNIGATYLAKYDWGAISYNQNNIADVYPYMSTSDLSISDKGLGFLIDREGLKLKPYNDSKGFSTVGVGHLIGKRAVTEQDKKEWAWFDTKQDAMDLLQSDLSGTYEKAIKSIIYVPLMQFQYDAIVSFTFNVGVGGLNKSNFLKELNGGNYNGQLMLNYRRPSEIIPRRKKEVNLFNNAIY